LDVATVVGAAARKRHDVVNMPFRFDGRAALGAFEPLGNSDLLNIRCAMGSTRSALARPSLMAKCARFIFVELMPTAVIGALGIAVLRVPDKLPINL
jgi:hypothetical protein